MGCKPGSGKTNHWGLSWRVVGGGDIELFVDNPLYFMANAYTTSFFHWCAEEHIGVVAVAGSPSRYGQAQWTPQCCQSLL